MKQSKQRSREVATPILIGSTVYDTRAGITLEKTGDMLWTGDGVELELSDWMVYSWTSPRRRFVNLSLKQTDGALVTYVPEGKKMVL
jgi:hypothetical protein